MSRTNLIAKVEKELARLDVTADNLHERIADERIAGVILRNCALPESPKFVPDASHYISGEPREARGGSVAGSAAGSAARKPANAVALHRVAELEAELEKARSNRRALEETVRSLSASSKSNSPTGNKENASIFRATTPSKARSAAAAPAVKASSGALAEALGTAGGVPLGSSSKRLTVPRVANTPVKAGMSWQQHMTFTVDLPGKMNLRRY